MSGGLTREGEASAPTIDFGGGMPEEKLGDLLRFWRQRRGRSQLELSLDAGISQRHLSFVESGRSVPSREMVLTLANTLRVPLRERNALLLAAGYAPMFSESGLDTPEMNAVRAAVDRLLAQQEPYPALALDRYWNVLKVNGAAPRLFRSLIDLEAWPRPRNLLELVLDPRGLRPLIANWEEVGAGLLERVEREAVGQVVDTRTTELLGRVMALPGVRELRNKAGAGSPVIPICFVKGEERSSWFSLVATVGTPRTVTAQELRVELMFPA